MAASDQNIADRMIHDFFSLKPIAHPSLKVAPTATGGLGLRPKHDPGELEVQRQRRREEEYRMFAKTYCDEENKDMMSQLKINKGEEEASQTSQLSEVDDTTSAGCIPNLNEFQQEEATEIYNNYFPSGFDVRYNSNLVITRYRQQILSLIRTHPVVIVRGSTGCGKTTQLPQYILDEYAARGIPCKIAVTQPRRIAATSVAQRVCHERNWSIGTVVGYQIALESATSPDTCITYMTTGVLLQKLIAAKNMTAFTHVIIDEVHERDQDTDLTILIVRKFLRTNSRGTKVILMSATIDTDIFATYFEAPVQGKLLPAPAIDIESKAHNVSEHYVTELRTLALDHKLPEPEPDNPCIHPLFYDLACKLITTFDRIEMQEQCDEEESGTTVHSRGSILVFLPGYEEIGEMRNRLGHDQEKMKWWILPLHSSITKEEQQHVFKVPPAGKRKIILSTNIAESSITVPDIRYVIDFCLTKILKSDPDTNYCSLQLQWASKANCDQRKGRAGRVAQGRVYRMVPVSFYDRYLELYSTPEMKRCPLELVILRVKRLDMGEPKALLALALERPELSDIERSILVLKEVGALSPTVDGVYSSSDGDITYTGHVMSHLPLDVHVSKLILLGFVFNCLEECIIMAASLSVMNFFSKPFQEELRCFKSRLAWANGTFSDVLAYLAAYTVWQKHLQNGFFHRRGNRNARSSEEEWARSNYIQLRRIREVKSLVEDVKRRLMNVGIKTIPRNCPDAHLNDVQTVILLKVVICGAFYPNYFVQEEMEQKDIFKQIGNLNPRNTVMVTGLPPKHSFLYESAIVNLFRDCSPHIQVNFDDQKAYVQFGKSAGERGTGVLPEVYLALKMRHQRNKMNRMNKLSIPGLSSEEIAQKLQLLESLKTEQKSKINSFASHRKDQMVTQNVLPRVRLPELDKITVRLFVTHVVDCGHFWAQYLDVEDVPGKEAFLKEKINMYQGKNLQKVKATLHRGMLVLAPWAEPHQEKLYYRAYIESLPNDKTVEVFFLDYGNTTTMPSDELREIDSKLGSEILTTPALAVQCKLSEIRPAANQATMFGHWCLKATKWFTAAIFMQEVIGQIYSVVQGVIRLELRKILPSGEELNINDHLLQAEFAEASEEDYMSKQNHLLREQCQDMDSVQLGQLNQLQQEDNVLRLGYKDVLISKVTSPPGLTRVGSEFQLPLRGPVSPLEVSYCGITKLTGGRRIKLERDSVNSVTLNREPENPHSCMLVACYVGLDGSGSAVMARNTTEMPAIHGLPALLTLLFCPQAEFRTDPQRMKFTGAIAGLGVHPNSNKPIYTDHDIELIFDTKLDLSDIININTVRICMNLILGISEVDGQRGPSAIKECQEKARAHLLQLLNRKRIYQEKQQFRNPFAWNQISPEHRIPPDFGVDCPQLFRLHDSVQLNNFSAWVMEEQDLLEQHASESLAMEAIKCKICDCTFYNQNDLKVHIRSEEHRKRYLYYQTP